MKNTAAHRPHAARLSAIPAYFSAVRFFALHFYFIRSTAAPFI